MSSPVTFAPGCVPQPDRFRPTARAHRRGRVVFGGNWPGRAAAFTLIEIIIAIVLIALASGMAVANWDSITAGLKQKPFAVIIRDAVDEARFQAMNTKRATALTFDPTLNQFVISDEIKGNVISTVPSKFDPTSHKIEIEYTPYLPFTDLEMLSNTKPQLSGTPTGRLLFYPSGASTPVLVQYKVNSDEGSFDLDPFNSAPPPANLR